MRRGQGRMRPLLGGLGYGLLTVLAFPPFGVWPLALVAILPLLWGVAHPSYTAAAASASPQPGNRWRTAARVGALTGLGALPAWLFEQRYLFDVTALGYPLLALKLATVTGLFVASLLIVRRAFPRLPLALVVPAIWVALEVIRGEVFLTGYAWFLLAHPLVESPALAAPAAYAGAYGVSFLLAALGGAAADVLWPSAGLPITPTHQTHTPRYRPALAVSLPALALWAAAAVARDDGGVWTPAGGADGTVRIAAVQTDIPQNNKMRWPLEQRREDFIRFLRLTELAAEPSAHDARPPDLIVWPETMFPGDILNPAGVAAARTEGLVWPSDDPNGGPSRVPLTVFADALIDYQARLHIPMLVGAVSIEGLRFEPDEGLMWDRRYNSVHMLIEGRVSEERYDKIHLTPFGEIIPFMWRWPALQNFVVGLGARGMSFDLASGERDTPLRVPLADGRHIDIVAPICFEITASGHCRRLVYGDAGRPRAAVMINLSNDGWFGRFRGGREQHLLTSRWRTVELGLPLIRAVNTGISAVVDPRGRVLAAAPAGGAGSTGRVDGGVETTLAADFPIGAPGSGTFFGRVGNLWAWLVLGAASLLAGAAAVAGLPRETASPETSA